MPNTEISRRELLLRSVHWSILAIPMIASSQLLAACDLLQHVPGPKLRIGCLPTVEAIATLFAYDNGFFEEEDLLFEKPILMNDLTSLTKSFFAAELNVIQVPFPLAISLRFVHNQPIKVVAWNNLNGAALVTGTNRGFKSFRDIGGKDIAVPDWYSMENIILQICLRKMGIETVVQEQKMPLKSKQTNLMLMKYQDMPSRLADGTIDGYIAAEPYCAMSEISGHGKIIRFAGDIYENYPATVTIVLENDIKREEWTQAVINALVKSQLWAAQNLNRVAHTLSPAGKNYLPVSEEVLVRAFTKYDLATYGDALGLGAIRHPNWNSPRLGFQPYTYPTASWKILELMKKTNFANKEEEALLQKLDTSQSGQELVDAHFAVSAAKNNDGLEKFPSVDKGNPYVRHELIEV